MGLIVFQRKSYTLSKIKYLPILQLYISFYFEDSQSNSLHKKDSKLEVSNYSPDKLMHSRQILYYKQFGFQKDFSTNHAILNLLEIIQKALDDGQIACGIFIDFEKAFDTVSHDILLEKLDHYGIRGISNDWFRSYLSDRSQYISINGCNSDYRTIKYGVPQGSVLGPFS